MNKNTLIQQPAYTKSTIDLLATLIDHPQAAARLIKRAGSLRKIFAISPSTLKSIPELSAAGYCRLQAAAELSQRCQYEKLTRQPQIQNSIALKKWLAVELRDRPRETFACLHLNQKHCVIHFEILFEGSIAQSFVYPREVVKAGLAQNAAAMIIAHNHPSGFAEPSAADCQLTQQLRDALNLVDIRLVDHFIVGANDITSLAEQGVF